MATRGQTMSDGVAFSSDTGAPGGETQQTHSTHGEERGTDMRHAYPQNHSKSFPIPRSNEPSQM